MSKTFAEIYRKVPVDQKEKYREFRSRHPLNRIQHNNVKWEYIKCGKGDQTLVLLPGGARYLKQF